jgi:predicted PurR-regulated permease PerM
MSDARPAIAPSTQAIFWLGLITVISALIWSLQSVLLPFILGGAAAYLLNPIVAKLGKFKISRVWAAALMTCLFILFVIAICLLVFPFLYRELVLLADKMPDYIDALTAKLSSLWKDTENTSYAEHINVDALTAALKNNIGNALKIGTNILGSVVTGSQMLISFISTLFITPMVTFFMLMEWDTITNWVDKQIPRQHYKDVKRLTKAIDGKISGFVRGQITLAVMLGGIYAIALSIAGLNYAVLIGLGAGLLSIIPLIGSIGGLLASVVVAWFQSGEITYTAIIASIFIVGQVVEGNILAPKFLGENVGLHPLWILFSLIAGGSLLGITGMLLAVPFVASVGVLTGYALEKYRDSSYYDDGKTEKTSKPKRKSTGKKKATTKTKAKTKAAKAKK